MCIYHCLTNIAYKRERERERERGRERTREGGKEGGTNYVHGKKNVFFGFDKVIIYAVMIHDIDKEWKAYMYLQTKPAVHNDLKIRIH